jgi:hypothetical protein
MFANNLREDWDAVKIPLRYYYSVVFFEDYGYRLTTFHRGVAVRHHYYDYSGNFMDWNYANGKR